MKVPGFPREFSDLLLDSPGPKGTRQRSLVFSPWDDVLREFVAGIRKILDDFMDPLAEAITDAIADQPAVRLYMNRDCTVTPDEPPLINRLIVLIVRSDSIDTSEACSCSATRRSCCWQAPQGTATSGTCQPRCLPPRTSPWR